MVAGFGDRVILPGDADWQLGEFDDLLVMAAAAVGPDAFVFSAAVDGEHHSTADRYARFYRYDGGRWLCVEVAASLTDLHVVRPPASGGDGLVALSVEGQVWFVGDETRSEQIPLGSGSTSLGYLTRLRRVGDTYFAAGLHGQCYRRRGSSWVADDAGLRGVEPPFPRKRPGDIGEATDVHDIVALANGDQYLCGSVATARPAIFWRPGGEGLWRWLGYAVDDPAYDYLVPRRPLVEEPDTVWAATDGGVLVKGNAERGFRIATDVAVAKSGESAGMQAWLVNAVLYQGAIHAGSNLGPFRLRGDGGWDEFASEVPRGPDGYIPASGLLDVSGGVLWAFGTDSIARHDGRTWQTIAMPPIHVAPRP